MSTVSIDAIIDEYNPLFISIVKRFFLDRHDAQDALQEIYITVNSALDGFKGNAKLSTWLYTIAYRKCLELSKKERLLTTEWLHDYFRDWRDVESPIDELMKKEWVNDNCNRCLTGIFHCLDNEARLLYILREIVELPYDDLEAICGKNSVSLRKIVSRAKSKINMFMQNECYLFNRDGDCQCRMKGTLQEIDCGTEIENLRSSVSSIHHYLGRSDRWEKEILEKITL